MSEGYSVGCEQPLDLSESDNERSVSVDRLAVYHYQPDPDPTPSETSEEGEQHICENCD